MILPPTGIKDAENVGFCTQIFFVGDCQPGSFEVAVTNPEDDEFDPNTAQRFLLSKGDFFHVRKCFSYFSYLGSYALI